MHLTPSHLTTQALTQWREKKACFFILWEFYVFCFSGFIGNIVAIIQSLAL